MKITSHKIFVTIVVAVVALVAGFGLYLSGSPTLERQRRLDGQRVSDLQTVANSIDALWNRKARLPADLQELRQERDVYVSSIEDPVTREAYGFRPTDADSYELCATFDVDSRLDNSQPAPVYEAPRFGSDFWNHPAGRYCYRIDVTKPVQPIKL